MRVVACAANARAVPRAGNLRSVPHAGNFDVIARTSQMNVIVRAGNVFAITVVRLRIHQAVHRADILTRKALLIQPARPGIFHQAICPVEIAFTAQRPMHVGVAAAIRKATDKPTIDDGPDSPGT